MAQRRLCSWRRPRAAVKVLRENLEQLGIRDRFRVQAAGAATYLRSSTGRFDVVFLDPPYDAAEEYAGTLGLLGGCEVRAGRRRGGGCGAPPQGATGGAIPVRSAQIALLEQGDAALSFYSHEG